MSQFDETAQDAVDSKHQGPFEGINVIHEHGYHDGVSINHRHLFRESSIAKIPETYNFGGTRIRLPE